MTVSTRARRAARHARGMTLIEVMVAMAVLLFGLVGLLAANLTAAQQNSAAAKLNRATAIGRDALATVMRWDYEDSRLTNVTANDAVLLGSGRGFSLPAADAFELDLDVHLTDSGTDVGTAVAVNKAALDFNGDGAPDYRRFVALSPAMAGGTRIGTRITALVYWQELGTWRRVALHGMKYDSTTNGAPVPNL
jgi:prepilin-type N-terminal cleavage/methylation domain-containing protein